MPLVSYMLFFVMLRTNEESKEKNTSFFHEIEFWTHVIAHALFWAGQHLLGDGKLLFYLYARL